MTAKIKTFLTKGSHPATYSLWTSSVVHGPLAMAEH